MRRFLSENHTGDDDCSPGPKVSAPVALRNVYRLVSSTNDSPQSSVSLPVRIAAFAGLNSCHAQETWLHPRSANYQHFRNPGWTDPRDVPTMTGDGRSAMPSKRREQEFLDRMWVRVRLLLTPRPAQSKGGRPFADGKVCFAAIAWQLWTFRSDRRVRRDNTSGTNHPRLANRMVRGPGALHTEPVHRRSDSRRRWEPPGARGNVARGPGSPGRPAAGWPRGSGQRRTDSHRPRQAGRQCRRAWPWWCSKDRIDRRSGRIGAT